MRYTTSVSICALALCGSLAGIGAAHAEEPAAGADVESVVVTGRVRSLEQFTPTGSRLGLSARETPGTLDSVNAEAMTVLGLLTVEKAAESLPGVNTGGSPGNPATFSMRGFTDGQITILHNGLYIGPSNMTNRPQNTFNLQTVEILKGPASVIYGQGAVGGAVNVTNRAPSFGPARYELQAGISSFGGTMFGIGMGGGITDTVGLRLDVSRVSSEGYVHNADSSALNATLSLLWRVRDDLSVQVSVDYAEDRPTTYFGTPLVPASFARDPIDVVTTANGYVIDKEMRDKNYNVADDKIYSHQIWPQVYVKWEPAEGVTFQNFTYLFDAKRRWINAESYTFNPVTQLIDRDRFFVFHEQQLWGDQASVTVKKPLGSLPNHFVLGVDYSDLDFERRRGFPDGDSVDPYGPGPTGAFGPIAPRFSPTKWTDAALFFEDALDVTDQLKLVVGGRVERLKLDRKNFGADGSFQPGNSFSRTYKPATYRIGAVYDVNEYVTPYVSYTTGSDPVGSNIFIVNAGENFGLSKSRQVEVGVKASTPDRRFSGTLAIYDIKRKNILTLTQQDVVSNVGEQTSRGVEVTADAQVTADWSVNGNFAYTDAEYARFIDTNTGLDASGNRPTNVPKVVVNAWTSVRNVGGLPLELGAGYRYLGARYGNTANTLKLHAASLVNAYATYDFTETLSVTARVDNLFDKDYVLWADVFYPGQVILGRPRSYELSLRARF